MSKVKMPDPEFSGVIVKGYKAIPRYLFTASQMEAYAEARVRDVLEEAAKVCDAYFKEIEEQSRSTYEEGKLDAADILEQRIKVLIPSQTGGSNVATD